MEATEAKTPTIRPLAGAAWMLVTGLLFVGVTAGVKLVGAGVPAVQTAFMRYLLGLVFFLPILSSLLRPGIPGSIWTFVGLRCVFHTVGVVMWFYAMTRLPLVEITAINYLAPICVAIGAALFLGERLRARRIAAIVAAMVGAWVILRPGFREISDGHMAMLVNVLAFSTSYIFAKRLAGALAPSIAVAYLSIGVTIILAPMALAVWVPPTAWQLLLLFMVAAFATAGHYTMMLAFAAAPMAVTQPVTFLQLLWATLLGVLVFAEPIDPWVIAGGAIIIAAVSFISLREAQLRRRAITPPSDATRL